MPISRALFAQTSNTTAKTASTQQVFSPISGLDRSLVDTTVDPCVDFYQYACGNWSKLHPIPSDAPNPDQFCILDQCTLQVLRGILERAAADDASRDANTQKIGD